MRHGHVTPNPFGLKTRCGGPALCEVCKEELRLDEKIKESNHTWISIEVISQLNKSGQMDEILKAHFEKRKYRFEIGTKFLGKNITIELDYSESEAESLSLR